MPNFSADEGRTLSGDDLGLATQSRQPQLRNLSDAEVETLVTRLRAARDRARHDANQPARPEDPGADEIAQKRLSYLAAALRRASTEQKRRLGQAAQAAGAALSKAEAETHPAPKADKPKARKPAARGARSGARAARRAQVTDRRGSGARKQPKAKPAPTAETGAEPLAPAPVQTAPGPSRASAAAAPPPQPATPPARDAATILVQDLTEKAATHAAKAEKAHSKAERAAKRAGKTGGKKDRKTAKAAQEKASKARRKARKFARRARKAAADLA